MLAALLPDPHGCPYCGSSHVAPVRDVNGSYCSGALACVPCGAPRSTATPGCPVRNAMGEDEPRLVPAPDVARERATHAGGPRVVR